MKIPSAEQIRQADQYTIEHEPIASIDLMERAASSLVPWLKDRISKESKVNIFCGMGNNGGDGFALARLLCKEEIVPVVYLVRYADKMSPDCETNYNRLKEAGTVSIVEIKSADDFPKLQTGEVVIDALFGTGLNRPLEGLVAELIDYLNGQNVYRIAIDIASGLLADAPTTSKSVFKADYTLTFQLPKLAFFMPENDPYVGSIEAFDIGLHPDILNSIVTDYRIMLKPIAAGLLHPRSRFSHKGDYGHALLIAGSEGKTGAALLSAKACMKTGVGLLSVLLPKSAQTALLSTLPEAMLYQLEDDRNDRNQLRFDDFDRLQAYNAIGVGPGLGKAEVTARALKRLIQDCQVPMVMDADALNILAENPTWLSFLPQDTILTPHPKEFERLFGATTDSFERIKLQREMAMKYHIIIVYKGGYPTTVLSDGSVFFNSGGNPGMATGGSGDVLTGVILSLLAQRYHPSVAAVLGVHLHALAGDLAAEENGQEALLASDITAHIGKAFLSLKNKNMKAQGK